MEADEDEMLDLDEFSVQEPICDPSYFGVQSPKVEELVSSFLDGDGGRFLTSIFLPLHYVLTPGLLASEFSNACKA